MQMGASDLNCGKRTGCGGETEDPRTRGDPRMGLGGMGKWGAPRGGLMAGRDAEPGRHWSFVAHRMNLGWGAGRRQTPGPGVRGC